MIPPITHAMVLAAGRGARLRPLTDHTPKPLVPVAGRPMVAWVLERLAGAGIRHVHMNTHHLGELIAKTLGDGSQFGVTLHYHPEPILLGTGGGLLNALNNAPELAKNPFLMINGDLLIDLDLAALLAHHRTQSPLATLVLRPDPEAHVHGIIATDDTNRVRRFLDLDLGGATRPYMFTGVQVLSPKIRTYMPADGTFPITASYLDALRDGIPLNAWIHNGYWADLGTPERLEAALRDLANGAIVPGS